ncbi:hypothetical protein ASG33_07220 [Dyadobacter sp. Leaf189]|nr:hypothetical protein ASG33_07220 [Dyadobacter sp. Leaf189]
MYTFYGFEPGSDLYRELLKTLACKSSPPINLPSLPSAKYLLNSKRTFKIFVSQSDARLPGGLHCGIQRSVWQIGKLAKETKPYPEEGHLSGKSDETIELYETFKNAILNLGPDIEVKPQKMVIGFTVKGKFFADVLVLKTSLKWWINLKKGQLDGPKNLSRDVSNVGTWGNGDYEIKVHDTTNLEYIMSLVKQALTVSV